MDVLAAIIFALLTLGVIGFQLALAAGAPWGEFAMGGKFPGRYPVSMRIAAVIQSFILAAIAWTVLAAAGVTQTPWPVPDWALWALVGLFAVGLVLNLITPSARERRIWAPVVAVMLACCIVVALLVSGCASPRSTGPSPGSATNPALDPAALSALDIPRDATRTATPAALTQAGALRLSTGASASFYRVQPGVDNWFTIDQQARIIGWSTLPGTEVGMYLVSADGSRTEVDASGLEQPLYTPDPEVDRGNAAGQRYLRDDQQTVGPAWLVVVPRTYDNNPGVFGVQLKSEW